MSVMRQDANEAISRWAVWLLIATSLATMVGRIAVVRATTGETPMLSANDRSRWCTVRSLVEDGSYVIDRLVALKHPETERRYWKSIDMVRHRGWDGKEHYYSSKPPLFSTLLAGQYWLIRAVSGATLGEEPFLVMRLMLVITNVLSLLLYFILLWKLLQHWTTNQMVVLYVMALATWGTFLTTFAVTLNNHLVAAVAVLLATYLTWRIWQGDRRWWTFALAGLTAAFAAANELPALSFLAVVSWALFWSSWQRTCLAFVPAVLLVAAGFFGTNYWAHGTVVPAYAHRSDGPPVATIAADTASELDRKSLPQSVRTALDGAGWPLSEQALVLADTPGQRWAIWDRVGHHRWALVATENAIEIRRWNNWYRYPGSYWSGERQGVDRGEVSRARYAWHVLVGHHGVFSLTPVWLLTAVGAVWMVRRGQSFELLFALAVVVLSVICLAFYISRPAIDRNYGGVCSGFRWMFWFIPLWLICMVPAVERLLASKWGRLLALALLMISTFTAAYAVANPWSHPWLYDWGSYVGWWEY